MTFWLGVDFGTSNTVAVVRRDDGQVEPLLFDGSPVLPSGVFVGPDGAVLTGADAERAVAAHPAGFEPNPKRRIDDGSVWLGEREMPVVDLVAAVLARVVGEARRVTGRPSVAAVLAHPAAWSQTRLGVLAEAARRAGVAEIGFVAEPVAAATYFAAARGLADGGSLVVYDLGAGTFDVSVVRRSPAGFSVVATDGLSDLGGLDLDAVVINRLYAMAPQAADAWSRFARPDSPADRRAQHALWRGARAAREQLSRHPSAGVHVPLADVDLHLTRAEFEAAAGPLLDRTVQLTAATINRAGGGIAGLFLVGGSSRTPLAATLLHRAVGLAPTVIDQPEIVVARGSLTVAPPAPASTVVPAPHAAPPPDAAPTPGATPPFAAPAPGRGRRRVAVIAAVVAVVVLVVAGLAGRYLLGDSPDDRADGSTRATLLTGSEATALAALADNRVKATSGAVVATDPATGAVLLAVSTPAPTAGSTPASSGGLDERRRALATGAFARQSPPGTVFHLIAAGTAVAAGRTAETQVQAGEQYTPPGQSFFIRNPVAGCGETVTLQRAVNLSCNTAFARLCVELGAPALAATARAFGFGGPAALFTDGSNLKASTSTTGPLDAIEPVALAQTCVGQRDVRMTPLLGSMIAGAAANGGRLLRPYAVPGAKTEELGRALTEPAAAQLRMLMIGSVTDGTSRNARISGYEVGGKAAGGEQEDAWFIGFAARDGRPIVAVAVLLEDAGQGGGAEAARIAGQVMKSVITERG